MTTNYKDPQSYLNEMVSKRGKSGPEGVYLTNLTVVAEAETDYGYKVNFGKCGHGTPPSGVEYMDWLELLVELREDNPQFPRFLVTNTGLAPWDKTAIYQFLPEGGAISLNVFLPYLDSQMFEYFVCTGQDILTYVSDFIGKFPTHIRYSIGYATSSWEDLVESGEVLEQDFSY